MTRLTGALLFTLALNVLIVLAQASMTEINPEGTTFFTGNGLLAASGDNSNPENALPAGQPSVSPETGNPFTDAYQVLKQWAGTAINGVSFLYGIITAVPSFLNALGFPPAFSLTVGAMWYLWTLYLVVAFFAGRND